MNRAALPVEAQRCIRDTVRFFESVIENGGYSGKYMAEAQENMQKAASLVVADVGSAEQVQGVNVVLGILDLSDWYGTPWGYCIRVLKGIVGNKYAGY